MVIVGTHMDRVRGEERDKRKVELSNIIKDKYLVSTCNMPYMELYTRSEAKYSIYCSSHTLTGIWDGLWFFVCWWE